MHPWPLLLVPFVVVVSAIVVLVARLAGRILRRSDSARRVTFFRTLIVVSLVLGIGLAVDYVAFQKREQKVTQAVTAIGGDLRILFGWPGAQYTVVLERPLGENEIRRLDVLNTLVGRNSVEIAFRCRIEQSQLQLVRDAFPDCEVITLPNGEDL